jgi:hypothetical protein
MKRALSQSQASELLRAASLLPPATRDRFMRAVDSRLCSLPHRLTDGDVQSAIVTTLSTLTVTTSPHLMCDAQPKEDSMPSRSLRFDVRTGELIEDDGGPLRDGQGIRVPLNMRDSDTLSPMQREVMADKAARLRAEDATARLAPRYTTAPVDAREAAYRAMVDEMTTAWQRTPVADVRGQREGDKCTINGAPGHLNAKLECVPDKRQDSAPRRAMTMDEMQRIKDAAYEEMVRDLDWRTAR